MASAVRGDSPPIQLSLPMDCCKPNSCAVQNYVDIDPGPAARDHACGSLTYDVHKGTDFRIGDLTAMRAGVAVLSTADGVVLGLRDGMADIDVRQTGPSAVKDRECGNGVVLGHPDGWTTQYCHLRRGSVDVKKGQRIRTGQRLGLIGLSGKTALSVRQTVTLK